MPVARTCAIWRREGISCVPTPSDSEIKRPNDRVLYRAVPVLCGGGGELEVIDLDGVEVAREPRGTMDRHRPDLLLAFGDAH